MQDMKPNAIFKSKIERDTKTNGMVGAQSKISSSLDVRDTAYNTLKSTGNAESSNAWLYDSMTNPYETGKSSIRTGQDHGYTMKGDFATKPGFNATTPRFNYIKNHIRMAEVPGPGSYDRNKSQETNLRKSPEKMYQEMSA
jgi:hypothetical protein